MMGHNLFSLSIIGLDEMKNNDKIDIKLMDTINKYLISNNGTVI
jgi:hypothetical protein